MHGRRFAKTCPESIYVILFADGNTTAYIGRTAMRKKPVERSAKTEIVEIYIPDSRHIRAWRYRKLMVRWIYSRISYIRASRAYLVTLCLTISSSHEDARALRQRSTIKRKKKNFRYSYNSLYFSYLPFG